jgi:microcystin-dependent protein
MGAQGPRGGQGPQGPPGKSSFSYLATAFSVPALSSTPIVAVSDTSWMLPGELLYIPGAGTFTVVGSPIDTQSVTLVNSGDPNNAPVGTIISGGTLISPASQRGSLGPAGPTGPQGPPGPQGVSGASAYTTLAQAFTIPAVGASAVAFVADASAFGVGQIVYVAGGDYCSIQSVTTTPNQTLTLVNQGYPGGAPQGTVIPVGATVSGTGPQGPQGPAGPIGPQGPQGAAGVAPTGTITMFGGSAAPGGWLLCQGQAVSRTAFASLFAIISTFYGSGDGVSTFNVPNLVAKVPVGLDPAGTNTWAATLGQTGGEPTHTLLVAEMAAHNHSVSATQGSHTHNDSGHTHPEAAHTHDVGIQQSTLGPTNIATGQATWLPTWGAGGHNTGATAAAIGTGYAQIQATSAGAISISQASVGSGTPHNNLQPYCVVNYIIKT